MGSRLGMMNSGEDRGLRGESWEVQMESPGDLRVFN